MSHLLVIGDSLAFHGPERTEAPAHPGLYPNVCAAALGDDVEVDLVARLGWTARDGWWAATKDPVVWGTYLPRADGVLLALGQFDQLPAAVPTWLRDSIPYLRPGGVRRAVRRAYLASAPAVIRGTGGRLTQLSTTATSHYLGRLVTAIRHFHPHLPIARLLPAPWDSAIYPIRRSHAPAVAAARTWCEEFAVPGVDTDALVTTGTNNPDGLHWGWDTHERIGVESAKALLAAGWGSTR